MRNHDDIVALCLKRASRIIAECGGSPRVFDGEKLKIRGPYAETEEPCGKGFIDLTLTWQAIEESQDAYGHIRRWPAYVESAIIVEVKSNRERWSAGSVTRQLKRYGARRRRHTEIRPESRHEFGFRGLVDRVRHRLVLVADREPTEAEAMLLKHERILVVLADELAADELAPEATQGNGGNPRAPARA